MTYLESFMLSVLSDDTFICLIAIAIVFVVLFLFDCSKQPKKKVLCFERKDECKLQRIKKGKVYCPKDSNYGCFCQGEEEEIE